MSILILENISKMFLANEKQICETLSHTTDNLKAILQSALGTPSVNRESRVVSGIRILENNRDVTYAGPDGKPVSFRTNDGLIDGLISHAGNRGIPAHLSHSWTDGKADGLNTRVGTHKNFRRDGSGNLVADFYAMPGIEGDRMLWLAENDPANAALSSVFDWNPIKSNGVTYAVPLSFDAADFVASGAACSALLTKFQPDTDMTDEQITKLVTDTVTAALKDFKPAGFITKEEAETAADTRVKAALSAYKPEATKMTDAEIEAIAVAAQAKVVATLGSGPLLKSIQRSNEQGDAYTAKLATYVASSPNRATAIRRLLADHPELGAAHEEHQQAEIAKLNGQAA